MRVLLLIAALAAAQAAPAADAPASEESVRRLLEASEARKNVDAMMAQMDGYMDRVMHDAAGDRPITVQQQIILADMKKKMIALLREEMDWDRIEPRFIEMYEQTFTEDEVNGMVTFYKSPAGRAYVTKMPQLMQHVMGAMQEMTKTLMPRLHKIEQDTLIQLKQTK